MADVSVPSIATATPDGDDTVLGVKDGIVKRFSLDNVGAGINFSAVNATTNMVFNTNGTEKMRLDSAGRLGLGVTPSAWVESIKVFEFGAKGGLAAAPLDVNFLYNTYYDGSERYRATDFANNFQMSGGAFKWFTAPSGTAGNPITFTQAMTLDASGKLQLNTTSTAGGYFTLNTLAQSGLDIYRSDSSANYSGIRFRDTTNANTYGQIGWDSTGLRLDGVAGNVYFSTSGTERARIDGSGNLIQTVNTTAATLGTNNTLTFSIVDNSTLRISVRGSDGTTRTATVALT